MVNIVGVACHPKFPFDPCIDSDTSVVLLSVLISDFCVGDFAQVAVRALKS